MREPSSPTEPSTAPAPFDTDEHALAWAQEVAREISWSVEERQPGALVFFPRPADEERSLDARLDAEVHLQLTPRAWPAAATLAVPTGTLPLDFRNLRAKLHDPSGALELNAALAGLPSSFRFGVEGELRPLTEVSTPTELRRLAQEAFERGQPLTLAWRANQEEQALGTHALNDALIALATVGELLSWSTENAYVTPQVTGPSESERAPAKTKGKRRDKKDTPELSAPREKLHSRGRAPDLGASPESSVEVPAPLPLRRPTLRSSSSSSGSTEGSQKLAQGVRVQIAGGPFLGRVGVVQQVDTSKGQARVLFGLLVANIALSDLVVARAPGTRPRLSSSHRRAMPSSTSRKD